MTEEILTHTPNNTLFQTTKTTSMRIPASVKDDEA
jgi:hypothetical protein